MKTTIPLLTAVLAARMSFQRLTIVVAQSPSDRSKWRVNIPVTAESVVEDFQ